MEEEYHKNILLRTCRLCSCTAEHPITNNLRQILVHHNIHIDQEDKQIYPNSICLRCKSKLYASKKHIRKNTFKIISAAHFTKHDTNCQLCVPDSGPHEFVNCHIAGSGVRDAAVGIEFDEPTDMLDEPAENVPSPAALKMHGRKLSRFCRLCALPKVQFSGKSSGRLLDVNLKHKLEKITGSDLGKDVEGVHPNALCKACVNRIAIKPGSISKQIRLGLPEFLAHKNKSCYVCSYVAESSSPASKSDAVSVKRKLQFEGYSRESIIESGRTTETNSVTKLPSEQCTANKELLNFFSCCSCKCIPLKPYVTTCDHILCSQCVSDSTLSNVCPADACSSLLSPDNVLLLQEGLLRKIFDSLKFSCRNHCKGCNFCSDMTAVIEHEKTCSKNNVPPRKSRKRQSVERVSLRNCSITYMKKRLLPFTDLVENYCVEHGENSSELAEALYITSLHSNGNYHLANLIRDQTIHSTSGFQKLNPDECLARRVSLRQTRTEYAKEYNLFKSHGKRNVLQCPNAVRRAEMKYFPDSRNYTYCNRGTDFKHNSTNIVRLIDVKSNKFAAPSWPPLRFVGYRWVYASAICATVQELIEVHTKEVSTILDIPATVLVKDGCDGLGDLKMWRDRSESSLPNKVIRYCFCVLQIFQETETGEKHFIYKNQQPNSDTTNRTLMTCIADENDKITLTTILSPILEEQKLLRESSFKILLPSGNQFQFTVDVRMSMLDEKLDRSLSGLQSSSSSFLCTLCNAERDSWIEKMGTYCVTRSDISNQETAIRLSRDDLNLTERQRRANALGVQCTPLRQGDPRDSGFDALHADINITKVLRDVLVAEIASENKSTEDSLELAELNLNADFKKKTGFSQKVTGMNGPYVRAFLSYVSDGHGIHFITNVERRQLVQNVFDLFLELRTIYRSTGQFVGDAYAFKEKSVYFGQFLYKNFPDCARTNYLHRLIEHCGEILARYPHSIGMFATDGVEAGNKMYRSLRRGRTNTASDRLSIQDILIKTWLNTSPKLLSLGKIMTKKTHCTRCHQTGHNTRTCRLEDERVTEVYSSDDSD